MSNKINERIKINATLYYMSGDVSKAEAARTYGISVRTLSRAIDKFAIAGDDWHKISAIIDETMKDNDVTGRVEPVTIKYIATNIGVTMHKGKESAHVHCDNDNYHEVATLIMNGDLEGAWDAADIVRKITKFSEGNITVDNGVVSVSGFVVNNSMTERLLSMMNEGEDGEGIKTFARFFSHLMNHAEERVINELYPFLVHNDITLNDDGSFYAYRAVTADYLDKYTKKIDNSVGTVVEMPRSMVDDNKNRTCSCGLHFASISYARGLYYNRGNRIVKVKVWPEDVVSIPTDYDGKKGRCCKYEVIEDVTDQYV